MIDLESNQFQVGWEPRIRDSVDQSNIPGESTISPQGLWRRSQDSWHLGAGQRYADSQDAQYGRFWRSVGVDPFTVKGELRLLVEAEVVDAQTESNLFMTRANGRIYGSDGQNVRWATAGGFGTPTSVTGLAAADVTGLASNGYNVFISQGASGVYITNTTTNAATSFITFSTASAGPIGYVKGRLMLAGSGSSKNLLWNITTAVTSSANNPTVLYTHPNPEFEWVGFAEGPNHIYCAGHTGSESIIYRTQIKADGSSLDTPVAAGTLPTGEVVTAIYGYLGFIFIGSNLGVRMATVDANGDLIFGALIETGSDVNCFGSNSRFVFFGWTDHPSGFSGIGCIDLSYLTAANTPAFCSWYYAPNVTGEVVDLTVFDDQVIFSVDGEGFLGETGTLVTDGYLDTGAWVWGIPDAKILAKIDGRHGPLPEVDTVRVTVFTDDDPVGDDCGCVAGAGSPFTLFTPNQKRAFKIDARVRLLKSSGGVSPVFNRINLRAFVNPVRSQVIRVPLIIHPLVLARDNSEMFVDVLDEVTFLQNLNRDAFITTYQDSMLSARVLIEDVLQVRDNNRSPDRLWAGTVIVTMRTVDEG
jgi:hypothetical protein